MDLLLPALALAMCYFYRQRFSSGSLTSPLHSFKAARAASVSVLPTIPEEEDAAEDASADTTVEEAAAAAPVKAAAPAPRRTAKHKKPRRAAKAAAAKAATDAATAAAAAAAPVTAVATPAPVPTVVAAPAAAAPVSRAPVSAVSAEEKTVKPAVAATAPVQKVVVARPRAGTDSSVEDDACSVASAESRYSERSAAKSRSTPSPTVDFQFGTGGDVEDKPSNAPVTFAAAVKAPIARRTNAKESASMPPPGFTAAAAAPQFRVWRADNATIDAVSRRMKTWNQAPAVDAVPADAAPAGFSLFASSAGAALGVAPTHGRKKLQLSKPKVAYVEPRWAAGPDGGRGFGRRRAAVSH